MFWSSCARSCKPDRSAQRSIWGHAAAALTDVHEALLRHGKGHGANCWHQRSPRIWRKRPGDFGRADRRRRLAAFQERGNGVADLFVRQVHERDGGSRPYLAFGLGIVQALLKPEAGEVLQRPGFASLAFGQSARLRDLPVSRLPLR